MNTYHELRTKVPAELAEVLARVSEKDVEALRAEIGKQRRVFVVGVGRVMLMMQAFAKRLVHLGVDAHVVGETTNPPLAAGDLLIAASASGETMTTVNMARKAKELGGFVFAITASPGSSLAGIADSFIHLPTPTKLKRKGEATSIQPMGNLFEQGLLLFSDIACMLLRERKGIPVEEMWKRHANLE